jgi:hypothetical protein
MSAVEDATNNPFPVCFDLPMWLTQDNINQKIQSSSQLI